MKFNRVIIYVIAFTFLSSCDDLIELRPEGRIVTEGALSTTQDLQELLNSTYDVLRGESGNWLGGRVQSIAEVMGDNIDGKPGSLDNADLLAYYNKTSSFFTGYTQAMFGEPYIVVYRANTLLQQIDIVPGVTEQDKLRISGEAKFLRAICNFEMVRLFAQPYGYTVDNSHLGIVIRYRPESDAVNRNTVAETYEAIVSDLTDAAEQLPEENGIYATSWAAKAYLSKVYFHMHNFSQSFSLANDVLENGTNTFNPNAAELLNRFSPGGTNELIFKQISTQNDHRGPEFSTRFRSDVGTPTLRISRSMYNAALADPNDLRGQQWYKIENEGETNERISIKKFDGKNYFDVPMITVTELKFIRAESAAENDATQLALDDVNDIRARAGLSGINANDIADKAELLAIIRDEKRKEHVAEGIRFHDLRRIGAKGESITIRGSDWDCPGMAIQFPAGEIAGAGGTENFTPNEEGGC